MVYPISHGVPQLSALMQAPWKAWPQGSCRTAPASAPRQMAQLQALEDDEMGKSHGKPTGKPETWRNPWYNDRKSWEKTEKILNCSNYGKIVGNLYELMETMGKWCRMIGKWLEEWCERPLEYNWSWTIVKMIIAMSLAGTIWCAIRFPNVTHPQIMSGGRIHWDFLGNGTTGASDGIQIYPKLGYHLDLTRVIWDTSSGYLEVHGCLSPYCNGDPNRPN